jgi:hypothetical protein
MELALKLIKEYGISAVLAFGLIYMNNRVTKVEEKLFDCYEARIVETKLSAGKHSKTKTSAKQYAVLVREPKVKRKQNA